MEEAKRVEVMEMEEEEVKWEAMEPEKDEAVLTQLKLPPHSPSTKRWRWLTAFELLRSEILLQLAGNFFFQLPEKDRRCISTVPLFSHLVHLESLILNFINGSQLPVLDSSNTQQLLESQANDNLLENLAPSVFNRDDSEIELMNDTDWNQHVIYNVEAEQLLDAEESSCPRETSRWTNLLMTNLILEISSAVFDQLGYALIGMVLAFVALLLATVELIQMARKERITQAGRSLLPRFHSRSTYTFATGKPVGTIVEYFGLAGAVWQCFYSTVEYTYARQKKDNPIKMCLLPFIFLLCVVISKLIKKSSIDKNA